MKTFVIFLTVLLFLYSSTNAGSLAYYPWERESEETNPTPFVYATVMMTVAAITTANHIHKLDKLSKKPLLSKKDVRGLKRRRILMPIGGAYFTAWGVGSISWAQEDENKGVSGWLYVTSAGCFVNGILCFVDGLKSHKVLSKYNSQKKR